MRQPIIARIQGPDWEVVIEIDGLYGDAGSIAARLRYDGVDAKRKGSEVLVRATK